MKIKYVTKYGKSKLYLQVQSFRSGIFQVHFYDLVLQIQHENNFLPTSKHRKAKVRRFPGICYVRLLHSSLKFPLPKMSENETPSWLWSQNSKFRVRGANQKARKLLFTVW